MRKGATSNLYLCMRVELLSWGSESETRVNYIVYVLI